MKYQENLFRIFGLGAFVFCKDKDRSARKISYQMSCEKMYIGADDISRFKYLPNMSPDDLAEKQA